MNNYEFYDEIMELLFRGHEGAYWDYKSDYPVCSEDKLKDIICMANNLENRDAYLIYGANNDGSICGIENTSVSRISSAGLTEFLRTKPFAGGYYPQTDVKTINAGEHQLDVVIIYNSRHTPYYLQEKYGKGHDVKKHLTPGTIYTRIYDTNTPTNGTASIEQTEYLWRKRFGYDLTPFQRLLNLLETPERWSETNWDSCRHNYNLEFPEFQIIIEESKNGYEELAYFYDNEKMFYAPLKINYLSTTLYETELWYMDEARCLITLPESKHMDNQHIFYYYILKGSVNGKLLPFFNYGKFQCHNRSGVEMPILLFHNKMEQEEFEIWVDNNPDVIKLVEEKLEHNAIYKHILSKANHDGVVNEHGIKQTAISYGLYKEWGKGLCSGRCFII